MIDLSHTITPGMITYKGLPGPVICDYWSREASAANFDDGSSFQIAQIEMVANTGTYVDAPFHRYADGDDLAVLPLEKLADLPAIMVSSPFGAGLATGPEAFDGLDVRGHAILIATGWSRHWGTETFLDGAPYLTAAAAYAFVDAGAAFVGIDSHNIDNTAERSRPVHTILLGAGVPIGEHLTGLERLPPSGFRFHAAPPKFAGVGTFPVRAYAVLPRE